MKNNKIIDELNFLRKKTLRNFKIFYSVIFFGFIIIYIMIANSPAELYLSDLVLVLLIPIGLIAIVVHVKITKDYKSSFKERFIPIVIKEFGENVSYSKLGLAREAAEISGMFGYFNRFKSEDLVTGKIDGVSFNSADVKIGYYTGGKNRRYVKVCHGQLYIFDFNKNFNSRTILREKNFIKPSDLERVKMENNLFNEKFHIFSNNKHDLFYILTPHFMEKILLLEQNHPGNLYIAFDKSQLHIGIHNNMDQFEPPILDEITPDLIQKMIKDLQIIKEIINDLNLNNNIFMMED